MTVALSERRDELSEQIDAGLDDSIGDNLLRLIFTACHPVLSPEARCTLTLRVMGGLTTDEIARTDHRPAHCPRLLSRPSSHSIGQLPFRWPLAHRSGWRSWTP